MYCLGNQTRTLQDYWSTDIWKRFLAAVRNYSSCLTWTLYLRVSYNLRDIECAIIVNIKCLLKSNLTPVKTCYWDDNFAVVPLTLCWCVHITYVMSMKGDCVMEGFEGHRSTWVGRVITGHSILYIIVISAQVLCIHWPRWFLYCYVTTVPVIINCTLLIFTKIK